MSEDKKTEKYRSLSDNERIVLEQRRCTAADWSKIKVAGDFQPWRYTDVAFSGECFLGGHRTETVSLDGFEVPLQVSKAHLHNVSVGNDVRINNIGSYIANYRIDDGAIIENVDLLVTEGMSSFGNGVQVRTINEAGGREVKIYDRLTAQVAYVMAMYRDRADVLDVLDRLIDKYISENVKSNQGYVGTNARITNNKTLVNVRIGPGARVKGVMKLRNGTVNSSEETPARLRDGVIAEDFIISSDSLIDGASIIQRCFVGQGARIGKGFSAENSLIFANSELFHGEACAIFAGPFTVSHHKSSLLLTALYSFYNAGSGTNFSNHMYKLGPIHQGVLERGCKTGSSSHIYWPSRVGAFSVIIGRHQHYVDTSCFPFSYLIEKDGSSLAVPGANLFTVGVRRDGEKWIRRDHRHGSDKLDRIQPKVFNPYTVGHIFRGIKLLKEVKHITPNTEQFVNVNGVSITRSRLLTGPEWYEVAVWRYLGELIVGRIEKLMAEKTPVDKIPEKLVSESELADGDWIDVSGVLMPKKRMSEILNFIHAGSYETIEDVGLEFNRVADEFATREYEWACSRWLELMKKQGKTPTKNDVIESVQKWLDSVLKSNEFTLEDAAKEFDSFVRVSYGIDGGEAVKDLDFGVVRGDYDENAFVVEIRRENDESCLRAERIIESLK